MQPPGQNPNGQGGDNQDRNRFQSVVGAPHMPYSGKGGSVFVNEMRQRLEAYFEIALRSVRDSVPKTIGYFLVRKSESVLHMELYNAVNSGPKMLDFLGEPPQIAERRKGLNEILETLRKAVRVLERDPE